MRATDPAPQPTVAVTSFAEPLLDRPAGEAARRLAIRQLDRVRSASAALAAGDDPEALHDLRVALRRLRSLVRAFASELRRPVGRKLRRQLRRLAAATNPGRDAEVGLGTVESWRNETDSAAERRALDALAARLAARRDRAYVAIGADFLARLDERIDKLQARLSDWRIELSPADVTQVAPPFRALVAAELARHHAALAAALDAAASGDADAAHRARLEAKRLRYLLEPVAGELAAAPAPVRRLRALQDLLGEANDLAVLAGELATLAAEAAAQRLRFAAGVAPRPAAGGGGRAGRAALAARLARRRAARRAEFERRWLAARAGDRRALERELAVLAAALGG